ncbi:MAG TPA: hypothetical protein VJ436_12570 [Anaerolineales bacterium]|nr:hypothetical protein [Anaerolineales bacterium]
MLVEIGEAIERAEQIGGASAVLIRGEGFTFSAGIDHLAFAALGGTFGENWRWLATSAWLPGGRKLDCRKPGLA